MGLFKKFVKRIDDDFGYDNEKLARDLQKIAEEHQALQLLQTDVINSLLIDFNRKLELAKKDNKNLGKNILIKEYTEGEIQGITECIGIIETNYL
jgi:hypothetical protein